MPLGWCLVSWSHPAKRTGRFKRIFRYLQGTKSHGVRFDPSGELNFACYSDADRAGDVSDRKSTSGFVFNLVGGPISWASKKQSSVSLSTSEAEYIALSLAIQEAKWIHRMLCELLVAASIPTPMLVIMQPVLHQNDQEPGDLVVANGTKTKILGVGTVHERVLLPSGQVRDLNVVDGLYVPSVAKNLMSIPHINKSDKFQVVFDRSRMNVLSKKSTSLMAFTGFACVRDQSQSPPWR